MKYMRPYTNSESPEHWEIHRVFSVCMNVSVFTSVCVWLQYINLTPRQNTEIVPSLEYWNFLYAAITHLHITDHCMQSDAAIWVSTELVSMSLHDYCYHYHAHILVGNKITGLHDRVINILVILKMIHIFLSTLYTVFKAVLDAGIEASIKKTHFRIMHLIINSSQNGRSDRNGYFVQVLF